VKILLHSRFYPNIGGIETVAELLTREWHRAGAAVTVVSDVNCSAQQRGDYPFPVYYRPHPRQWLSLMLWSELFVHMNISLKALWPWLIVRRPFVAVNHAYYHSDREGHRDWRERLKLRAMSWATNIAVSQAVAQQLPEPCSVILNPVDTTGFRTTTHQPRSRELVFLGRLVSDKGCDLLLRALDRLVLRGLRPKLTIIGEGPERTALEQLTVLLNLQDQVEFTGAPANAQVARLLSRHEILVVPSVWQESFGVVALEGAAAGCVVLGSDGGGLPEAIGPVGVTFRRGDVGDLAEKIEQLLHHREEWQRFRDAADAHLVRHHPEQVARRYLEVFERTLAANRQKSSAKPQA